MEVNLEHVSKRSVGSGVVAQGPYENKRRVWRGSRTISRILKVLEKRWRGKKRRTGDKSRRMGKKRKQESQLSGVCGINKSTTELQGGRPDWV